MNLTKDQVYKEKKDINFPSKIFIDGKYQESISGKKFKNFSPIDGRLINNVVFSQKEDVDLAVQSARKVFEKGSWSKAEPSIRKKILLRFADLLEKHKLELALLDTIDVGKTINDTFNADVPASLENIRWYAELIDKVYDDIAPTSQDFIGMITKEKIVPGAGYFLNLFSNKRCKTSLTEFSKYVVEHLIYSLHPFKGI